MFKFILLGIGFMLIFEGLLYFLFSKEIKKMMKLVVNIDNEKIKFFSFVLFLIGSSLIYFTFKFYKL